MCPAYLRLGMQLQHMSRVHTTYVLQIKANIPNYRRIVIGSDNCTGQNKNGLLIRCVCVTVTVVFIELFPPFCRTLCALAKEGEQVRYTTTEKGHGKGVWDGEG